MYTITNIDLNYIINLNKYYYDYDLNLIKAFSPGGKLLVLFVDSELAFARASCCRLSASLNLI